jgi:predicted transglutaminase-like cysteine proteinase
MIRVTLGIVSILFVVSPLHAQKIRQAFEVVHFPRSARAISDGVTKIATLIKAFDLNDTTEDGYSITRDEYNRLVSEWNTLSYSGKVESITNPLHTLHSTLSLAVLHALYNGERWDSLVRTLSDYNAQDLSLTKSTFRCPVPLHDARNDLADRINSKQIMTIDGLITVHDEMMHLAAEYSGVEGKIRLIDWLKLINSFRTKPEMEKVVVVNNFFNDVIIPLEDPIGCDYWLSVIETIILGTGDCDDYAVAKYVSLRLMAIPSDRLIIAAMKFLTNGNAHAALLYYPRDDEKPGNPYVPDNLPIMRRGFGKYTVVRLHFYQRYHSIRPVFGINEAYTFTFDASNNRNTIESAIRYLSLKFDTAHIDSNIKSINATP